LPDDDAEAEELLAFWQSLLERPLPLDRSSADAVWRFPLLTPRQKATLAARLARRPGIARWDSLIALPGFDSTLVQELKPFVHLAAAERREPAWRIEVLQRLGRALDLPRGYRADSSETAFAGPPWSTYTRVVAERGGFSGRLALENDAGEPFSWGPADGQWGFDHAAGALAVRGSGFLKRLVLGDFLAQEGQGLLLGAPYRTVAGASPTRDPLVSGSRLTAYGNAGEVAYFRGAALAVAPRPWIEARVFLSRRRLSASLDSTSVEGAPLQAVAVDRSGLHRTPGERARRGVLTESMIGSRVRVEHQRWQVGLHHYAARFTPPIDAGETLYQAFAFRGRSQQGLGLFADRFGRQSHIFAEVGRLGTGATGWIAGLGGTPSPHIELLLVIRRYGVDFAPIRGNAFRAGGLLPQNEEGAYLALRLVPARSWTLAGSVDLSKHPWPRSVAPLPSQGIDAALRFTLVPAPFGEVYLQLRHARAEQRTVRMDAAGHPLTALAEASRTTMRLHARYTHSTRLELRARVERLLAHNSGKWQGGLLLYSEAAFRWGKMWRFVGRWTTFASDAPDVVPFAYESDVYSRFHIQSHAGIGDRVYILITCRVNQGTALELKYGQTTYARVYTSGSGPDRIEDALRRTLRVQMVWRR
jgi:hypothetical protein